MIGPTMVAVVMPREIIFQMLSSQLHYQFFPFPGDLGLPSKSVRTSGTTIHWLEILGMLEMFEMLEMLETAPMRMLEIDQPHA